MFKCMPSSEVERFLTTRKEIMIPGLGIMVMSGNVINVSPFA